jgi:osmotically-inducible protein OsmY
VNTIARQRCVAVAILMTVALTGCWPARFTEEPGVAGTVVSSEDRKPIADAHVTLRWSIGSRESEQSIDTDARGRFRIRPMYRWGLYSYLGENWPFRGWVDIEAPGFAPQRREWSLQATGAKTRNVGVVALTPMR